LNLVFEMIFISSDNDVLNYLSLSVFKKLYKYRILCPENFSLVES
jgi:hypothetical protein